MSNDAFKKTTLDVAAAEVRKYFPGGFVENGIEKSNVVFEKLLGMQLPASMMRRMNTHCPDKFLHCCRVALILAPIFDRWNTGKGSVTPEEFVSVCFLHDIGLLWSPVAVCLKSRVKASSAEMKELWRHPYDGVNLLSRIPGFSVGVLSIVADHHEFCDGSGYPSKKTSHILSRDSRLLCLGNELDVALFMERGGSREEVFKLFKTTKAHQFLPEEVEKFEEDVSE